MMLSIPFSVTHVAGMTETYTLIRHVLQIYICSLLWIECCLSNVLLLCLNVLGWCGSEVCVVLQLLWCRGERVECPCCMFVCVTGTSQTRLVTSMMTVESNGRHRA